MEAPYQNRGAILLHPSLFTPEQIAEISTLARAHEHEKTNVHETGVYSGIQWHQVDLEGKGYAWLDQLYAFLGIDTAELSVFYYLSPGTTLHPHRDLTGASLNNRLRFHVPVYTNDQVDFRVSHERIIMRPGECWVLDTSYLHSVHNGGDATRVHIVIECNVNAKIKAMLPKRDIQARGHDLYYCALMGLKLVQALLVNSVKNPAYMKQQMGMVVKFIRWRVLKIDKAS